MEKEQEKKKSIQHMVADGRKHITCFPSVRKTDGDSYSRGVLYSGEEGRALTTVLHMCSFSGFVALPWRGSNPPPS